MAKATAPGADAEEHVRKQALVVSEARGKGGDILRQLLEILAKLSLASSTELRDACGVNCITLLILADQAATQAGRRARQNYHAEIQRRKQAGEDLAFSGPPLPLVQVWRSMIQAMDSDPQCPAECRK
ncbi:unnamed protein product [Prorocentrum cordatum]|uniref:Uncharacterized protein n=1 Tax=Prorocentrum cordatum TaxID=2364126 RepID=A0ABN9TXM4_9DINO|nr:unnamed protein product [Polarella glacialis]